ncbi:MAG: lipid-A-disaccharide synthase N-terminal domain-containing protein [Phycisphaerales bacterium]
MTAKPHKRIKWEPAALMVLVLALGFWLAFGPRMHLPLRPGASTLDIRMGDLRGVLEAAPAAGSHTFRVIFRGQSPSREMTLDEAASIFGASTVQSAITMRRNPVFRFLNITSWVNVVWVGIGLGGQVAFSGRMLLQWFISERRRESVITESFWWFSLFGALALFSYFVWRQDPVGILGQASGIVIYARNLRLIHKRRRRMARDAAAS